jgi:DNA-binding LacI/PurR family transcriptional regulator
VDNFAAACEATDHLLSLGHRRIGFISHAPLEFPAAADRRRGYLHALERAGRRPPTGEEAFERIGRFSEESGYECANQLLALRARPTAIFAGNDMIAYGAMQAAKDAGLRIPDDLSIVGFDDNHLSRFTNPPMTTVAVPAASLGAEAARIAVESIIGSAALHPVRMVLSHHLSVRRTTGAPPSTASSEYA